MNRQVVQADPNGRAPCIQHRGFGFSIASFLVMYVVVTLPFARSWQVSLISGLPAGVAGLTGLQHLGGIVPMISAYGIAPIGGVLSDARG